MNILTLFVIGPPEAGSYERMSGKHIPREFDRLDDFWTY